MTMDAAEARKLLTRLKHTFTYVDTNTLPDRKEDVQEIVDKLEDEITRCQRGYVYLYSEPSRDVISGLKGMGYDVYKHIHYVMRFDQPSYDTAVRKDCYTYWVVSCGQVPPILNSDSFIKL